MVTTDGVSRLPTPWTWHPHSRSVGRAVPTTQPIVLVGLRLQLPGSRIVSTLTMVVSQSLVPIEKENVRLRCELDIAAETSNPDKHFRGEQIGSHRNCGFMSALMRLHRHVWLTTAFQPRRLRDEPAGDGCKRLLGRHRPVRFDVTSSPPGCPLAFYPATVSLIVAVNRTG